MLVKLPSAERVRIDERKVRGYLLAPTHPVGRFKARVFAALGFDERAAEATGEVVEVEDTEFGCKYTVAGDLRGPTGTAQVLTVWINEPGQDAVRLVTVRPRWP